MCGHRQWWPLKIRRDTSGTKFYQKNIYIFMGIKLIWPFMIFQYKEWKDGLYNRQPRKVFVIESEMATDSKSRLSIIGIENFPWI